MALRGVLLDLQGVLYQDGEPYPGAVEAVAALRARGLALRFLTNTSTDPRRTIVERMRAMGFAVEEGEVFSPALVAARHLRERGARRIHLAAEPALAEDFAGFEAVDEAPDAVILADLHLGFTWERLDGLFAMLRGGAELIALHKNRACIRDGRLGLDLGPFVAALEYAAQTRAYVVGKPSRPFFDAALADMGLAAGDAAMVGDDIEFDIGGALDAGLAAVQVRTGKYTPDDDARAGIAVTARLDSVADLPGWV